MRYRCLDSCNEVEMCGCNFFFFSEGQESYGNYEKLYERRDEKVENVLRKR